MGRVQRNCLMHGQREALIGLVRQEDWSHLSYKGAAIKASKSLGFKVSATNYRWAVKQTGRTWSRGGSIKRHRRGGRGDTARMVGEALMLLVQALRE